MKVSVQPRHGALVGENGAVLVDINLETGETTFGEHYSLDEAAKVFWRSIGALCVEAICGIDQIAAAKLR